MHDKFDSEASLREARARLPLGRLLEQLGHAPGNGKWKSFTCPFCRKKSTAGLFEHEGIQLFKCQSTSCPTAAKAMDAVGYLQRANGSSRGDAFAQYLKMAGVWRDRGAYKLSQAGEKKQNLPGASLRPAPREVASAAASKGDSLETLPPAQSEGDEGSQTDRNPGSADGDSAPPSQSGSVVLMLNEAYDCEPSEEMCREALREFYAGLILNEEDNLTLFEKRSIPTKVSQALGFRSNVKANLERLVALTHRFSMDVLLRSGLWMRRDGQEKPNSQFYGLGRTGQKRLEECEDGEVEEKEEWGWVHPMLIPYFNSDGELFCLHPHKGGAKGRPRHVYIPREAGVPVDEKFEHVLITEGEFKAAAVRARLPEGWGVAALPGISMAKNYACREQLEAWLRKVRARHVVVVYDNEEKSDPALPGYKPERSKRHDALIWARFLAWELADRLRLRTEYTLIPREWRDEKGKADWDGSMAVWTRRHLV